MRSIWFRDARTTTDILAVFETYAFQFPTLAEAGIDKHLADRALKATNRRRDNRLAV